MVSDKSLICDEMVQLVFYPGTLIWEAADLSILRARELNHRVIMMFNDKPIVVGIEDTREEVLRKWALAE